MNRVIDDAMLYRAFSAAKGCDDAYKGHPTQELIRVILSAALEVQDRQKLRTLAVTRGMVRSAMAANFYGHCVDDALACGTDLAEEVLQAAIEAALAHDDAGNVLQDAKRYDYLVRNCQDTADEHSRSGQLYFGTYARGCLDVEIDHAIAAERGDG